MYAELVQIQRPHNLGAQSAVAAAGGAAIEPLLRALEGAKEEYVVALLVHVLEEIDAKHYDVDADSSGMNRLEARLQALDSRGPEVRACIARMRANDRRPKS